MRPSHPPAAMKSRSCPSQDSASQQWQWGLDFVLPCLGNCGGSFPDPSITARAVCSTPYPDSPSRQLGQWSQLFQQVGLWNSGSLAYSLYLQLFLRLCKPWVSVLNTFLFKLRPVACFLNWILLRHATAVVAPVLDNENVIAICNHEDNAQEFPLCWETLF